MTKTAASQSQLIQECMQSLRRVVKALENYSRSVEKKFDLTGPQLWALWELGRSGPMGLKDLAARMHLEPSTVTGVVDRLVAKDLVVRTPDPSDRRRISMEPTFKGQEILDQAPHPAQGHLLNGLESMERGKVLRIHQSLRTLETVLGAEKLEAPFFFSD
ncbi:MAG TPA: MarR family transcriptional regulator [Geothrix sp.]|nr:MarR family transcriptional regulator [Geothrix sp.]